MRTTAPAQVPVSRWRGPDPQAPVLYLNSTLDSVAEAKNFVWKVIGRCRVTESFTIDWHEFDEPRTTRTDPQWIVAEGHLSACGYVPSPHVDAACPYVERAATGTTPHGLPLDLRFGSGGLAVKNQLEIEQVGEHEESLEGQL